MPNSNVINLDLNLDENYIAAAVEEIVRASIIQALGEPAAIVKTALDKTINIKVDRDGRPTTSSYGGTPFLQYLAEKTMNEVVRETLAEVVKEQADVLKEEVKKQLSTKEFRNDLINEFLKGVLATASSNWKMPIHIGFEKKEDY